MRIRDLFMFDGPPSLLCSAQPTGDDIKGVAKGLFGATDSDGQPGTTRAQHVFVRRLYTAKVTDGGTAAAAQGESPFQTMPTSGKVLSANVTASIAVASSASNNAQFQLWKRAVIAGVSQAAVLMFSWDTTTGQQGALTAWLPAAMINATPANLTYNAGDSLTVLLAKTGTGVAVAGATSFASIDFLVEEGT